MNCDSTIQYLKKRQEHINDHIQALSEIHDEIKAFGLQNRFATDTLLLLSTIKFFSYKDESYD